MSSFSRNKFRSVEVVTGPTLPPTLGWTTLALFAQTMFAQLVTFRGAMPSLVTIAVVLYAAQVGARRGLVLGIIAGLLEDCLAGTGGAWTVATLLTALLAGAVSRGFFSDGFAMLGALVAVAVILRDTAFWTVMQWEGYPPNLVAAHVHPVLWQAALSGALAIVYLVVRSRVVVDQTAVERF